MLFNGIVARKDELAAKQLKHYVSTRQGGDATERTDRVPAEAAPDWEKRNLISLRAGERALVNDDMAAELGSVESARPDRNTQFSLRKLLPPVLC